MGQHHTPQRGAAPTSPPEQVGSRVPRGTQVSGVGRPPATPRTRETSARVRKRHAHPEMPGASSRLRSRRAAPGNAPAGRREQVRAGASRCEQVRALGRADMKRLRQELGSRKQSQVEGSPAKSATIEHAGRGRGGCRTGRQARETPRKRPRGRRAKDRQRLGALPGGTRGSRPCPRSPGGSGDARLRRKAGDGLGEVRAEHHRERRNPADSRSRANPNQDEVKDAPSSTRAHRSQTWAHEGRPPREQRQRRPLAPGEGRRQPECPHKTGRRDRHARLPVGPPREGRNAGRPHAQDHAEPAKPPEAGAHAAARGVRGQPKGQRRGRSRRDSEKRACHAAGGRGWYRPGKSTAPQLPTV